MIVLAALNAGFANERAAVVAPISGLGPVLLAGFLVNLTTSVVLVLAALAIVLVGTGGDDAVMIPDFRRETLQRRQVCGMVFAIVAVFVIAIETV